MSSQCNHGSPAFLPCSQRSSHKSYWRKYEHEQSSCHLRDFSIYNGSSNKLVSFLSVWLVFLALLLLLLSHSLVIARFHQVCINYTCLKLKICFAAVGFLFMKTFCTEVDRDCNEFACLDISISIVHWSYFIFAKNLFSFPTNSL